MPGRRTPPVLPGAVEPAEVAGRDPAPRLVRMRVASPPVGEMPQTVVQPDECPGGHRAPVIADHPRIIGVSRALTAAALAPRRAFTSAVSRSRNRLTDCCSGLISSLPLPCRSTYRRTWVAKQQGGVPAYHRLWTNTSWTSLVSPDTRFDAHDVKATWRPSPLNDGHNDHSSPSAPSDETLTLPVVLV